MKRNPNNRVSNGHLNVLHPNFGRLNVKILLRDFDFIGMHKQRRK